MSREQRQFSGERIVFFNKWFWNNWTSTCKKINLDTDHTSFIKINSECIIDLNENLNNMQLLKDDLGENLGDLGVSDDFLLFIYFLLRWVLVAARGLFLVALSRGYSSL